MAKPKKTVWAIDAHTKAKHKILQTYLQAWLPIMSKHNKRLLFVDGFAGPGVYEGGEPGSPIIALNAYLQHTHRHLITAEIVYVFIEERADRCDRLAQEIKKLGKLPDQVKVQIVKGLWENEFSKVLDNVEEQGKRLAPTFAFVDPFGYSDASMHLSGRFLQFKRCEALIYFPLSFVHRFLARDGQEAAMTALFGTDRWREAIPLAGAERQEFLHNLFRDQLQNECGLRHVRSFEIQTETTNAGYHLFFGTNNDLGLERMKEAMWRVDRVQGTSYADSTQTTQPVLFQAEPDTTQLARALRKHFGQEPFSIDDAEKFTLTETPFLPSHIRRRTLVPLENEGKVAVVSTPGKRKKGTFPSGTILRFT